MTEFLKFSEIAIAIALIFIVLIQNKNTSLSLSTMSSSMGEITKRGAEKVLQNTTIVLGTLFILNSVALFLVNNAGSNISLDNALKLDNITTDVVSNSGASIKIKNSTNSGTSETK